MDIKRTGLLVPHDHTQPFTIECWIRFNGPEGQTRVCLQSGRYSIGATADDKLIFGIFHQDCRVEVTLHGPTVHNDEWYYIVGTYDGTVARLYVNAMLVELKELHKEALMAVAGEREARREVAQEMRERERRRKEDVASMAREEANEWMHTTKEGRRLLKQHAKRLVDQSVLKIKLSKNAGDRGARKMERHEAEKQARGEYEELKAEEAKLRVQEEFAEEYKHNAYIDVKMTEEAAARGGNPLRLGSACPTARAGKGKHWFAGDMCQVAFYLSCAQRTRIQLRYTLATRNQSGESERLFGLAAKKFRDALAFSYDDVTVLDKYVGERSGEEERRRGVKRPVLYWYTVLRGVWCAVVCGAVCSVQCVVCDVGCVLGCML